MVFDWLCPEISLQMLPQTLAPNIRGEPVFRATSHMSQEPWPCNGENPWLSAKRRTMCVGKAVICSHGSSSIVWSENGPCCGTIAYLIGGKNRGGSDLILYVSNFIDLRELFGVFVSPGICLGICSGIFPMIYPESVLLKIILKKSWSPGIFVRPTSWRWAWRKFW